jgi:hypothetical protein
MQFFTVNWLLAAQDRRATGRTMAAIYADTRSACNTLPGAVKAQAESLSRFDVVSALNEFGLRQQLVAFRGCRRCHESGVIRLSIDGCRMGMLDRLWNLPPLPPRETRRLPTACTRSDFAFITLLKPRDLVLSLYLALRAYEKAPSAASRTALHEACTAAIDERDPASALALFPLLPLFHLLRGESPFEGIAGAAGLPRTIVDLVGTFASSTPQGVVVNYDENFIGRLRSLKTGDPIAVEIKASALEFVPLLSAVLRPLSNVTPWLAPILSRLCDMGEAHGRRIAEQPALSLPDGVFMRHFPDRRDGEPTLFLAHIPAGVPPSLTSPLRVSLSPSLSPLLALLSLPNALAFSRRLRGGQPRAYGPLAHALARLGL